MDSIDLFPTPKMSEGKKIMVTIRLVLILSILLSMIMSDAKYLWMGMLTSGVIGGLYYYHTQQSVDKSKDVESFTNITTKSELEKVFETEYLAGTKKNPLSNVLLTDYMDNPNRKPAPPTFNEMGIDSVNKNVKKTVQELNPTINNTSKQLFGGLYNQFELNNSNRSFFSTPNTKIPNDQGAFANFLYGSMSSCKEDGIQCIKDNGRYNLY